VERSRWEVLSEREQEQFPPLCPDFVVGLLTVSDQLPVAKRKMLDEWLPPGLANRSPDPDHAHFPRQRGNPNRQGLRPGAFGGRCAGGVRVECGRVGVERKDKMHQNVVANYGHLRPTFQTSDNIFYRNLY